MHPFLRRLTPPNLHPITLLGTVHVPVDPPPCYLEALQRAGTVLFEQDYRSPERMPPSRHQVPVALKARVFDAAISLGYPMVVYQRGSPMELGMLLLALSVPGLPLDLQLFEAVRPDQRCGGLETALEQRAFLDALPVEVHLELLLQALGGLGGIWDLEEAHRRTVEQWREGRVPERIGRLGGLLGPREEVWLPRILEAAREAEVAVVCGAAHVDRLERFLG